MKEFKRNKTSEKIFAAMVFFISFLVYLLTLAPTISWGDSAEFITVAYTL